MAITSSAKKALRASKHKRVFNLASKNSVNKAIKQLKKLVAAKDVKGAEKFFPQVQKALDKAVKTNLLKKNTVARKKSRLSAMVKKAK